MDFSSRKEKPEMRFEREINIYGDEAILKRFQANETSVEIIQGKISALISESELIELENSRATMYSKLASAIMDIDALTLNFSDLTTKYNTVSGQYTSLDSRLAQYKSSVDGLSVEITHISQNLDTLETWKNDVSVKITDSAIIATVTESNSYQASVNSLIEQKANSIRMKATTIEWSSTYSSMTSSGELTCRKGDIGGWTISEKSLVADSDNSYIDAGTWRLSRGKLSNRVNDKNYTPVTVDGVSYAYQYVVQSPQPDTGNSGNFLYIRRVKESNYSDDLPYTSFEYPFKINYLGTATINVLRTGYKEGPDDGVEGAQLGNNGSLYLTGTSDNAGIYFYYNKAKTATHHIYAISNNNINITPYLNINYDTNQTTYRLYCNGPARINGAIYANGNIDLNENSILMGAASVNMISSGGSNVYFGNSGSYSGYTVALRGNDVRLYAHSGGGVYLGSSGSTAITSDENLKYIYEMDERYEKFFLKLKPILYTYKNRGHRKHVGFGARQVKQALDEAGISTEDFAGLLIDKDAIIGADEFGSTEDMHFDELYSLRYEEFGPIYAMMLQKALKRIRIIEKEIGI